MRTLLGAIAALAIACAPPFDGPRIADSHSFGALDLLRGASALLGPLSYLGYDAVHSPLLDMVHGWAQLLRDPNVRDRLGLADALLADHGAATARRAEAAIATARLGDAQAPPWDDLVPVLRQIAASPARVRARLDALQQPRPRSSAGGSPTS